MRFEELLQYRIRRAGAALRVEIAIEAVEGALSLASVAKANPLHPFRSASVPFHATAGWLSGCSRPLCVGAGL
jgi:hypothetical protein